jgi:hypothetical protein
MALKFKLGDVVQLRQFPDTRDVCWVGGDANRLVGRTFTLTESYANQTYWVITFDGTRWAWPETGMTLLSRDEHITVPAMKAVRPDEQPQWLVSRAATIGANECNTCQAPLPCRFHSDAADHIAASFGAGFAAAHRAGWKP